MHARGVVPDEERLVRFDGVRDEALGFDQEFLVQRALPLLPEWPGVDDLLGSIGLRPGMDHAALTEMELFDRLRIFGEVIFLGIFAGVEVIEDAEKFVEAVIGRQMLVAVAEMVLAELSRGVAKRLQKIGDRRVFG